MDCAQVTLFLSESTKRTTKAKGPTSNDRLDIASISQSLLRFLYLVDTLFYNHCDDFLYQHREKLKLGK